MAEPQSVQPAPESAQAQNGMRRQPPSPEHQVKMLTKRLGLNTDQQNQLLPILSDRDQAIQSVRNDSSLSPQDRRAKIRSAREAADSKIQSLLTDAQKDQYRQLKQQMQHRAHGRDDAGASNQTESKS